MKDEDEIEHRTLIRAALRDAAYRSCPNVSREEVDKIFDATLEEISDALARGEDVKLIRIGTFKVRSKPERVGRNPKTGVEATIKPRRVVTFKPSVSLVDQMNDGAGNRMTNEGQDNDE
jgi:integration host factor subunit alpha